MLVLILFFSRRTGSEHVLKYCVSLIFIPKILDRSIKEMQSVKNHHQILFIIGSLIICT